MNKFDVEKDIQKIVFGGQFARVQDSLGREYIFILKQPSLKDRAFIDFIHDEAIEEGRSIGLLSKLELLHMYKHKGIWTEENDKAIEELGERIRDLKSSRALTKREKRVLNLAVEVSERRLGDLLRLKHDLFSQSLETHADEARRNAFVFAITHDEFGNKFWPTWNGFQEEVDNGLIRNIIIAHSTKRDISGKRIRFLSRSNIWRLQWQAAKSIGDLFNKPIVELDSEQLVLIHWSQVYDSVYESMDRPDDDIIDDDEKLDEWFENQHRKRQVEDIDKGKEAGGIKLSNRISRHGEIFIVANPAINPNAPDINKIEGLNDSFTRKFKAQETETIKKKGLLNEKDLRTRKNHIARKLIGSKDAILGKGGFGGQARGGKGAGKILPGGTIT